MLLRALVSRATGEWRGHAVSLRRAAGARSTAGTVRGGWKGRRVRRRAVETGASPSLWLVSGFAIWRCATVGPLCSAARRERGARPGRAVHTARCTSRHARVGFGARPGLFMGTAYGRRGASALGAARRVLWRRQIKRRVYYTRVGPGVIVVRAGRVIAPPCGFARAQALYGGRRGSKGPRPFSKRRGGRWQGAYSVLDRADHSRQLLLLCPSSRAAPLCGLCGAFAKERGASASGDTRL